MSALLVITDNGNKWEIDDVFNTKSYISKI